MSNICERCGQSNRATAMFCIGCTGKLPGFAASAPSVSDRRNQATSESAYSGQLRRGDGVLSRHIPAGAESAFLTGHCVVGVTRPPTPPKASRSFVYPRSTFRAFCSGGDRRGSQENRDVPVPTSARAAARGRRSARGGALRPHGPRQATDCRPWLSSKAGLTSVPRCPATRPSPRRSIKAARVAGIHHLQRPATPRCGQALA